MKKNIFWIAIIGIALILGGCAKQPNASKGKNQYTLDKSKTVAPQIDGKLHGIVKKYASSGQPWSVETYVNGVKNGPAQYYTTTPSNHAGKSYNNGKAWIQEECIYKNGKKDGICKIYDIDSKDFTLKNWFRYKSAEVPYRNGVINGKIKKYVFESYYTKKIYLREEKSMKNGKLHGAWKTWSVFDSKLHLKSITNYKNGFKDGAEIKYGWINGSTKLGVQRKTRYKNGVEVGPNVDYLNGGKTIYFDKASVQRRTAQKKEKSKGITKNACRYVKNYGNSLSSDQKKFQEAIFVCKYGWSEGDRVIF